jgi:hypothetical protein
MQWNDLLDHRSDLRRWLSSAQPSDESRSNWWLGWVLVATWRIESASSSDEVLDGEDLDLVVRVINLATEEDGVDPANRAIRLANLADLIPGAGRFHGLPSELRPDAAVRQCLDLIQENISNVEADAKIWRSMSIDRMRRLREIKNLITPISRLRQHVRDGDLSSGADEWIAIHSQLP